MNDQAAPEFSIIIPAYNEAQNIKKVLPKLLELYPEQEIILVDDGSTDETQELCQQYPIRLIRHPYNKGNGASIKTGARNATGRYLVFMDADGQHHPEDVERLLESMKQGYDMVVGARTRSGQSSFLRHMGNGFYNRFASMIVGQKILDLTSGFRMVEAKKFREFLHLLPNGFSYPSTITMAFFRAGYSVNYMPIETGQRLGKSHIRIMRDGIRFTLIIYKIATLYSPLKVFVPFALLQFMLGAINYYHTYTTQGRFTNMSAVFFSSALIIFLIGLVSEQVTVLMYQHKTQSHENST